MSQVIEIALPDIGNFQHVPIIEIPVQTGDQIAADTTIVVLENDKSTMEIPCPFGGKVVEVLVNVGDQVSQGSLLLRLAVAESASGQSAQPVAKTQTQSTRDMIQTQVLVLGAGPGGYTAAFRCADLGLQVVLVERSPNLGGVCLNVGCIPSKALLHAAHLLNEAQEMEQAGIHFGAPQVNIDQLRAWKDGIVTKLTGGLAQLAKKRKIKVVHGQAQFVSPHELVVDSPSGEVGGASIQFQHAIIAAGSSPIEIPGFPHDDPRLIDSSGALALACIPQRMLIVGGGIIGLEMATVYAALGCKISVVELMDSLIPGCDKDLVRPLERRIKKRYEHIYLNTKVTAIKATEAGLQVQFSGDKAPQEDVFDQVLVAVGRRPNGKLIQAQAAGVAVDERGFICVDKQMRTNVPHIFAIGDIVGNPMLAHKAVHEAKVAAEVIAGHKVFFDAQTIPSVAYTDPEIAWMGLSEEQAKQQGIAYEKGVFPWAASGRSLSLGRDEGMTKILFDRDTKRILGAGIVGPNAGELIAELVLALEMGADAEDLALTIHPHPTLSETVNFAAEMALGTITDLYAPRKSPW